jgi:hypothetical protein
VLVVDKKGVAEAVLLQAQFRGILPMWIAPHEVVQRAAALLVDWTEEQKAQALAWRERDNGLRASPVPSHVSMLIASIVKGKS